MWRAKKLNNIFTFKRFHAKSVTYLVASKKWLILCGNKTFMGNRIMKNKIKKSRKLPTGTSSLTNWHIFIQNGLQAYKIKLFFLFSIFRLSHLFYFIAWVQRVKSEFDQMNVNNSTINEMKGIPQNLLMYLPLPPEIYISLHLRFFPANLTSISQCNK